jgi:hypothetical protein
MKLTDLQVGRCEHEMAAVVAPFRKRASKARELAAVIEEVGSAAAIVACPRRTTCFGTRSGR